MISERERRTTGGETPAQGAGSTDTPEEPPVRGARLTFSAPDAGADPSVAPEKGWSWVWVVSLLVLWSDLFLELSFQWSANEQYAYGWFIPLLAGVLFWARWQERPFPRQRRRFARWEWACAALALILIPIRICHEANPDWPAVGWALTAGVTGLTLYFLYRCGGRSWVRHFLFPIMFTWVAVRWPWRIERPMTQSLASAVTTVTVEVLGWFGVPALQHGQIIEIATGNVGVEEACSGVRSLLASIMMALFLGEFQRLNPARRWMLLLLGVVAALVLNVGRTLTLTWRASVAGALGIESWHDWTGLLTFFLVFAVLWGASVAFRTSAGIADEDPVPVETVPRRLPSLGWLSYALAGWVAFLLVGTEFWFRSQERARPTGLEWSVRLPTSTPGFREVVPNERLLRRLRHDELVGGTWLDADGTAWLAYFIHWGYGSVGSRMAARSHRPELCLRGAGYQLERDLESKTYHVGQQAFSFRRYVFARSGVPVYVFFCLREYGGNRLSSNEDFSIGDRLNASWHGIRQVGQRSLEVAVSGSLSADQADAKFATLLPSLVTLGDTQAISGTSRTAGK